MDNIKDLVGQQFGKIVVLEKVGVRNNRKLYKCLCACGVNVNLSSEQITRNKQPSCKKCRLTAFKDLTGKTFNYLTVVKLGSKRGYRNSYFWLCRCICGTVKEIAVSALPSGHIKSCGCYKKKLPKIYQDLTGKVFEYVTVIERVGEGGKWVCQCKCGKRFSTRGTSLISGATKSCGCLRKEKLSGSNSIWWNGGSSLNERRKNPSLLLAWSKQVKRRDNFTCKKCFFYSKEPHKLQAHHIHNFSKYEDQAYDINNGATLCVECHKFYHKKYGIKDNNQKQFNEYLKGNYET